MHTRSAMMKRITTETFVDDDNNNYIKTKLARCLNTKINESYLGMG